MRISDWSSDVCSSDLTRPREALEAEEGSYEIEIIGADGVAVRDFEHGLRHRIAMPRMGGEEAGVHHIERPQEVQRGVHRHDRRLHRPMLPAFDPDRKSTRLNSSH